MDRTEEFRKNSIIYVSSDLYPSGKYMPSEEGRLTLWDLGFRHGFAVYDAGRAFRGKPWQLPEILSRLMRTCKACNLELRFTPEELANIVKEVCAQNARFLRKEDDEDLSYMIEATPGEYGDYGKPLPPPLGKGNPTVIVRTNLIEMKSFASRFSQGLHLVTPSTRAPPPAVIDSKIKTHSRHYQAFALREVRLVDPQSYPLFLDIHGNLAETHTTNFFLVYQGELMTPLSRNILEGNGRANVLRVAQKLNIPVIERDLQPYHLYNADEAFVSSESRFLSPVTRYNGVSIGGKILGPVSSQLLKAFIKEVNYDVSGVTYISSEERQRLGITFDPFQ